MSELIPTGQLAWEYGDWVVSFRFKVEKFIPFLKRSFDKYGMLVAAGNLNHYPDKGLRIRNS
jgi:hypothetical protein